MYEFLKDIKHRKALQTFKKFLIAAMVRGTFANKSSEPFRVLYLSGSGVQCALKNSVLPSSLVLSLCC